MYDLSRHPYFREYIDPKSGVKSYILKEKLAQMQTPFYFTNPGITENCKYLWFRCMNYPALFWTVGLVSLDPDEPFIRHFPSIGSPCDNLCGIIPGTDDLLFASGNSVFKSDIEGNITKLITVGNDIIKDRKISHLFTHASFSTDGKHIIMDMMIADKVYLAEGNIETGEVKMLHKFVRNYNHAMFSPADRNLVLIDQDWMRDPDSGERFDIDQRMWVMDIRGTRFEPMQPDNWFRHNNSLICHDFWSKDGMICWPDLPDAVYELDVNTKVKTPVWNQALCHCHTIDRKYWVGDASPYSWNEKPCRVIFFDRETNKEIDIFSAMPKPVIENTGVYHLDPHPGFSNDSGCIISMTTVDNGNADLAVTPVEPLIERCCECGTVVSDVWEPKYIY